MPERPAVLTRAELDAIRQRVDAAERASEFMPVVDGARVVATVERLVEALRPAVFATKAESQRAAALLREIAG